MNCSKAIVKKVMSKRKRMRSHDVWHKLWSMGIQMSPSSLERNYFRALPEISCKKVGDKWWYTWQEVK